MREPDPKKRLTIKQVVDQYSKILKSRWWWQLRAPVYLKHRDGLVNITFTRSRWFLHTVGHTFAFKKALPKPSK